MKPETRKEVFLAKMAGESVTVPDPITREELYYEQIIEAISGGGGGGGGLSSVAHDETMTGAGTALSPLGVDTSIFGDAFVSITPMISQANIVPDVCVINEGVVYKSKSTQSTVMFITTAYDVVCNVADIEEWDSSITYNKGDVVYTSPDAGVTKTYYYAAGASTGMSPSSGMGSFFWKPLLDVSTYNSQNPNQAYLVLLAGLSNGTSVEAGRILLETYLEVVSNKVTSLSAQSTDTQYPSAKCVYDMIGDIETLLGGI